MFKIQESLDGEIGVLKVSGVMMDPSAMALPEKIKELKLKQIILDLSEVKLMNSCYGLGAITVCWGLMNRSGGELKIANPSPKVSQLLEITKLNQVIKVYDSVKKARTAIQK